MRPIESQRTHTRFHPQSAFRVKLLPQIQTIYVLSYCAFLRKNYDLDDVWRSEGSLWFPAGFPPDFNAAKINHRQTVPSQEASGPENPRGGCLQFLFRRRQRVRRHSSRAPACRVRPSTDASKLSRPHQQGPKTTDRHFSPRRPSRHCRNHGRPHRRAALRAAHQASHRLRPRARSRGRRRGHRAVRLAPRGCHAVKHRGRGSRLSREDPHQDGRVRVARRYGALLETFFFLHPRKVAGGGVGLSAPDDPVRVAGSVPTSSSVSAGSPAGRSCGPPPARASPPSSRNRTAFRG